MSSSSVWVQLYYKGKDEPKGQPVKIKVAPEDVADLKAAVLPKLDPAELAEVFVYPAGTTPTFSPNEGLDPGGHVPLGTTSNHPLIVVAPDPQQSLGPRIQQQWPVSLKNYALQQQLKSYWFKVSGTISRPVSHAGARYELYKLASSHRGLYPPTDDFVADKRSAFSNATVNNGEVDRSLVSFAVVFQDLGEVAMFIDGIKLYLMKNKDQLVLLNDEGVAVDEPTATQISVYPIDPSFMILQTHYKPKDGEPEPGSPLIDMIVDVRSSDITVDVTLLSRRDPTFQFQRIENDTSFALADPESAHIFPSAKCLGIYGWLDKPEFNRIALSRDVHLNFDGTGRGRGKSRKTQQTFAIRPLRPVEGYATCTVADVQCYKIPLELVLNVNEIGETLLTKLGKNAALRKRLGSRWTIDGSDVAVYHPTGRRVSLKTEQTDNGAVSLVTGIPGVEDLNDCWSNTPANLYDVEAAEIMEKCFIWNYLNALELWSSV